MRAEHIKHTGSLLAQTHVEVFVSISWSCSVSGVSSSNVSFQDSSCFSVSFSRPPFRPHKSLKPSKHFTQSGHLSEQPRGLLPALCRRVWRYLSWSLREPERAFRLLAPDSAVTKIRQRWRKKNSKRCSCFQQNSKKTENKCQEEREEGWQKKNSVCVLCDWGVYKNASALCGTVNVCRFLTERELKFTDLRQKIKVWWCFKCNWVYFYFLLVVVPVLDRTKNMLVIYSWYLTSFGGKEILRLSLT